MMWPSPSSKRGFTLIEAIIVIAVISILAALIIPMMVNTVQQEKYKEAAADLEAIYKAIFGDGESSFGYHGDMGCLPYSLTDLFQQGDQPAPSEYPLGSGVIIGWKGPYLSPKRVSTSGEILDPWGNPYLIVRTDIGDGFYTWQLVCTGPDGSLATAEDNLYYPEQPLRAFYWGSVDASLSRVFSVVNQVFLSSKVGEIENFVNTRYIVYYPLRGVAVEDTAVPTSYYQTSYGGRQLNFVPAGKRVFQGIVYSYGVERYGKYYTETVPYSGQVQLYMDLTLDRNSSLMESLIVIPTTPWGCSQPANQKRICIRSSLNYNPSGLPTPNGVDIQIVGLGSLSWNSFRRWYEVTLPNPPYSTTQTYTFTISSNGGASTTVVR